MRTHRCRALGCSVIVREAMLMCSRHWGLVPMSIQVRVWTAYRAPHLGRDYVDAVRDAVDAVREREGATGQIR